jgi:teichuronic acid biosynthesis glycosyltransferase TuaC
MRILIVSHMYPSAYNNVYGIFVHEQAKALKDKGVNIKVISPVPWTPFPIDLLTNKWKEISNIPEQQNWEGISVWYPRYLTFPKALFFESSGERMYKGIKSVVTKIYKEFKFDLIHADVALPDGYASMKLSKELKVPFVVTIHGHDFYGTINKNSKCRRALNEVLSHTNKIITVSNELKNIGIKNFKINNKTAVIGNGIPLMKIINNNQRNWQEKVNKKITLLSVSYLIKRKAIDYNLRAFSKLSRKYPNLKYIIVGDGIERKNLEFLSEELGISNKVEFLGMLSHDDVMRYMAKADIFSLPSWNEAFGVVYIEAMAHGKPVIGCKGEGIEDFVEDGKTGLLVKLKDVDSLTQAIDYLLSNPDEAKAMGERARKMVLENYTWEKNAVKTISLYQEVLELSKNKISSTHKF